MSSETKTQILTYLLKYTDDIALVSLLCEGYTAWGKSLQNWINISKNKEIIISSKHYISDLCQPLTIMGVEKVSCFKYLWTYIDSHLHFIDNTECFFKKLCRGYTYSGTLMTGWARIFMKWCTRIRWKVSMSFNIVAWYRHLDVKCEGKLSEWLIRPIKS